MITLSKGNFSPHIAPALRVSTRRCAWVVPECKFLSARTDLHAVETRLYTRVVCDSVNIISIKWKFSGRPGAQDLNGIRHKRVLCAI